MYHPMADCTERSLNSAIELLLGMREPCLIVRKTRGSVASLVIYYPFVAFPAFVTRTRSFDAVTWDDSSLIALLCLNFTAYCFKKCGLSSVDAVLRCFRVLGPAVCNRAFVKVPFYFKKCHTFQTIFENIPLK